MRRTVLAAALLLATTAVARAQTPSAYRILSDVATPFARTVNVAIDAPLSDARLASLTAEIAAGSKDEAPRLFVNFYLSGKETGKGPWASTIQQHDIAVFVGDGAGKPAPRSMHETEARPISAGPSAAGHTDVDLIAGAWSLPWPYSDGRVRLWQLGGRTLVRWTGLDGRERDDELALTSSLRGRRLDVLRPGSDDHFILRSDGLLELHSGNRLVATGRPLSSAEPAREALPGAPPLPERTRAPLTAIGLSVIAPWPQTTDSNLSLARVALRTEPAPAEATVAVSEPPAENRKTYSIAGGRSSASRSSGGSGQGKARSQEQVWKSLARYLEPNN